MEWEIKTGNSKIAQVKQLESLCKYHTEGRKYIIDEVFEVQKEIKDKRKERGSNITTDQYKININYNKHVGVYIIIDKNNNCYIGSTTKGFRHRFIQHWNNYHGTMDNTYSLLHDNEAEFRVLYDMTGVNDVDLIRMAENEFIQYFKSLPNYNVLNRAKYAYYKGGLFSEKKKKRQYINIKVDKDRYSEIINLLKNNDLLEYCIVK